MRVTQALELMRRDLGRNVKLVKSARLPYDVLLVMAESTTDIPEMDSTMHEVRLSIFIAGHRSTSVIVDSEITKKETS
jgi:hypothetical protein